MVNYLEQLEENIPANDGRKFSIWALTELISLFKTTIEQSELDRLSDDVLTFIDLHYDDFEKESEDLHYLIDGDIFFTIEKIDTAMSKEQANEIRLETIALIEKGLKMAEELE